MDGLYSRRIDKNQVRLKAFSVGSTKDVQPQYPVTVQAEAMTKSGVKKWERSLNKLNGSTTIGNAKDMIDLGIQFQKHLREGDTKLRLLLIMEPGVYGIIIEKSKVMFLRQITE